MPGYACDAYSLNARSDYMSGASGTAAVRSRHSTSIHVLARAAAQARVPLSSTPDWIPTHCAIDSTITTRSTPGYRLDHTQEALADVTCNVRSRSAHHGTLPCLVL